ncbi:class I SAM-dependent methyltransferase [Acidithiobacillus ferridurans]|uniref:class I SAM-dependent methyltransferase n=1 Tax=Acidithiobacillus ferridurans TaxID=1232575 RepID=UPI001C070416|nr:class I SAM-dependent methyltransferase [Acidithiobacillus ferridurans]MBU2804338.1 class I SAM-dependent methyltransferase [Acidithiobacillus ferridurans]
MPFSKTVIAEPFLDRAVTRLGPPPVTDREQHFYSYFSEIWKDGYDNNLHNQYAAYLPFLPRSTEGVFLDIGCGAGEFVAFLNAKHIPAEGIDMDAQEVERAKRRGVIVHQANAREFLARAKGPFTGISLLEVIEHLPPDEIPTLLTAIFSALVPGGVLLVETINIKHPLAFHSFYTDPTHQRPIPSDLLVLLLQWHGFTEAKIVYTHPVAYSRSQAHDPSRAYFNYAVIARKPTESGAEL